ncbi:putative secreted protein [Candidatus Phytoplasma solani]|uniref:hypothetical protein n=1 Tax=Candidatus Phytoplasma solani TaxID=69896 RepID=UPI0032DA924B
MIIFLFLIFFKLILFYFIVVEGGGAYKPVFNLLDSEIDYNQKHFLLTTYENGSFKDKNQRDFYSTDNVPRIANRERLNTKQSVKTSLSMISIIGSVIEVADIIGISDKIVADKEQKIANLVDIVELNLLFDPQKRVFLFFDESELYKIKQININFCKY